MSGHTPGPWRVENERAVWGGHGFSQKLAELEEHIERANLNTSLADLYTLLAEVRRMVEEVRERRIREELSPIPKQPSLCASSSENAWRPYENLLP